MASDHPNAADPGLSHPGPEQDDGDLDYQDLTPAPVGGGCYHCGHPSGECMSPGDHCPLAKKMFAPKVEVVDVPDGPGHIVRVTESEGVWVTFYHDHSMVMVHGDELAALRAAVQDKAEIRFMRFGESL